MDDRHFWDMIETAWQPIDGQLKARQNLAAGESSENAAAELSVSLEAVITSLSEQLERLAAPDLLAFDRILERKLYDLDRAAIHAYTDGSDDGFLYARGFIVIMGQDYYDVVNTQPAMALDDFECDEMCYLSWHLYAKKFGDMPASGISRESFSNPDGWNGAD